MTTLRTWGGRSQFRYEGSVEAGTDITYGEERKIRVEAHQYAALRTHFCDQVVPAGTSHTDPPSGSLGAWLQKYVTPVGIASYVAPILVHEEYAERIGVRDIRVTR